MDVIGIVCGEQETVGAVAGRETLLEPVGERGLAAVLDQLRASLDTAPLQILCAVDTSAQLEQIRGAFPDLETTWTCRPWEAELAGALGGRPGVVVHSALRASAMSVDAQGNARCTQQTDELLGEEGSALWLSTRALRLAVQGREERVARSERLERALTGYFGADTVDEVVDRFEAGHVARGEMAGFVSVLLHLAEYPEPEPACRALLLRASRRLAGFVRSLLEQTRIPTPLPGSWTGAAMHGTLIEIFREDAARYVPGIDWRPPVGDAGKGALRLAAAARAEAAAHDAPIGPAVWRRLAVMNG